ncbi:MOP flippase family protein [Marinobacter sp. TBZ242]|uniref:MOP flippase family protein n=1 Tax=Marinobacter azerbaijanicus TaxID=3050455 RepID=A0ABT7ICW2_9GAMM|nr:MOP flippase family protein [Marinobacter sp. TBZ242]MDL0431987.1 MOP flippase family protein [Marinobacter sp. TBZ242]
MSALVSGTKWVALETIISRILQLLSALFVARVLGPEVMGTVALVLVALEIFRLFSQMGITQALIHHKNPTSEQLATLYTVNWILAAGAYLAIYFSAPFVAAFFEESQLMELITVAGLSVLIAALGQQTFALLQKELHFKAMAMISMIASTINVIAAIVLVSLGWGIWSIVIGQLLAAATRSGLAFIYGLRKSLFSGFGLSFKAVKPMLSFGLYQTGAMSMNMINSRADQLIIGKTMGASALGLYSIGSQITLQAMQQINSVATRVAFPAVSKSQDDLDEVKRIYLAMIGNVLLVSTPLFVGLAVVSPVFVDVVLGEKWADLSPVLSILCGYVLVRSLGNMNGPLVMGLGKANWSFYWNLGLLFIIPAVVLLSSLAGNIESVALALLLTQLVLLVVAYFYWVRRLIGPCAKEYFGTIAKPTLAAGAMGAVVAVTYDWFNWQSNVVTLLVLVLLGAIFYLLFSMVFNAKNLLGFGRNVFTKRRSDTKPELS